MWTNLKLVVMGSVLLLGPVGLRVWTRPGSEIPPDNAADVAAGQQLFTHVFKPNDPLCRNGDGLGPVFNANSCVACHHQGGLGGSGGLAHNVTTFVRQPAAAIVAPLQGVVHAFATDPRFQESLAVLSRELPATSRPTLQQIQQTRSGMVHCALPGRGQVQLSQRNTPALFGSREIDAIPDRILIVQERQQRLRWGMVGPESETVPVGRALRLGDGRIGKFGWKAQSAGLSDFVQAACANELGLGNPGQSQPTSLAYISYTPSGLDLSQQQCDQITAFCRSLDRPVELLPSDPQTRHLAEAGQQVFHTIGCTHCHTPNLGSVEGIYSDLLLHRMGVELVGEGDYNEPIPSVPPPGTPRPGSPAPTGAPLADEWRTPPLWGVADSAPYMHDGRAFTLVDAIAAHGGQAATSRDRFQRLPQRKQQQLIAFLHTLRAPQPQP